MLSSVKVRMTKRMTIICGHVRDGGDDGGDADDHGGEQLVQSTNRHSSIHAKRTGRVACGSDQMQPCNEQHMPSFRLVIESGGNCNPENGLRPVRSRTSRSGGCRGRGSMVTSSIVAESVVQGLGLGRLHESAPWVF